MDDLNPSFCLHNVGNTAPSDPIVADLAFHSGVSSPGIGGIGPVPISVVGLGGDDEDDDGLSSFLHDEDNLQELMPLGGRETGNPILPNPPTLGNGKTKPRSGGRAGLNGGKAGGAPKKRYHCTVERCQYSTPYAKDLARHMRKHTGEKPYQCQKCTKSFSRYDKLKIHALTHEGIRPYKCNFCSYASSDSGSLRKHVRIHTNERPYKCQLCPYQARDSSQLVIHLRHHTGDTPYVCTHEGCKAAFKTPSDLQRHSRLHTGEKPYGCPHCPYRAAVKCNLSVHIRKVHLNPKKKVPASSAVDASSVCAIPPEKMSPVIVTTANVCPEDLHLPSEIPSMPDCISSSIEFNAALPTEEHYVPNSNNFSNAPKTDDPPVRSTQPKKRTTTRSKKERLPFQYACKSCPVRCDTMKAFKNHVLQMHKDINLGSVAKSLQEEAKSVIVSPASAKSKILKTDVAKLFECNHCPAAFAAEESLKCHLKQHSPKTISSVGVPPHVDLVGNSQLMGPTNYARHDAFIGQPQRLPDMPVIVRSETTVIAGQTQQVYVIVRNNSVPEKPPAKEVSNC